MSKHHAEASYAVRMDHVAMVKESSLCRTTILEASQRANRESLKNLILGFYLPNHDMIMRQAVVEDFRIILITWRSLTGTYI